MTVLFTLGSDGQKSELQHDACRVGCQSAILHYSLVYRQAAACQGSECLPVSPGERAVGVDVKRCRVRVTLAERALLRRLRGLPAGAHTIILVKSESGAEGVESWAVNGHRLEQSRGCGTRDAG